jgi:hypothetical protein
MPCIVGSTAWAFKALRGGYLMADCFQGANNIFLGKVYPERANKTTVHRPASAGCMGDTHHLRKATSL